MRTCTLESSELWLISGVTTVEIGKLSSALREFRRVFFECLWGGTHFFSIIVEQILYKMDS